MAEEGSISAHSLFEKKYMYYWLPKPIISIIWSHLLKCWISRPTHKDLPGLCGLGQRWSQRCSAPQWVGTLFRAPPESCHFVLSWHETSCTREQSAGNGPHWPPHCTSPLEYTWAHSTSTMKQEHTQQDGVAISKRIPVFGRWVCFEFLFNAQY